jgi:hypothetical protein
MEDPESVPSFPLSLADVWVPLPGHVIIFLLQPLITPMTSPCSNFPPLLIFPLIRAMKAAPVSSYLNPQARSTFSPPFPSLPAARLLGIELEISQLPPATPSNSGKLPLSLYLYPVPFNYISHAESPRHDDLLTCALEQRTRPRRDLAVRDLNSDEPSADNQIASRSTASPL